MAKLFLDFETRSELNLTEVGAWKYAAHPSTEVLCMAYKGGGDLQLVTANDLKIPWNLAPPEFQFTAHNAHFEYAIYNLVLAKRYGWAPRWDPKEWGCTMARALMVGLPPSLEEAGRALGLKIQKDLEGRSIMLRLCKPIGRDFMGEAIYDNDPKKLERLYEYCRHDVETEIALDAALPQMPDSERRIWELDLEINRRGVMVDIDMAQKAAALAGELTFDLNAQLHNLTDGKVDKATRVAAMKNWIKAQGVDIPTKWAVEGGEEVEKESLDKAAVTEILERKDLPPIVREVIAIRRQVGKSSTAKYEKTLQTAGADGRVRGALQYHAAHTGRWGGRLIQPQNYPKGFDEKAQVQAVDAIKSESNGMMFSLIYGDKAMDALSDSLRGTIIAGPKNKLISADYSAIEARVLFWLAGDKDALATYHRGESPYIDMAEYIYQRHGITKKGDPKEYDIGKRTILGAGYGMGAEKFRDTVKIQTGMDISEDLAKTAIRAYREKYCSVPQLWREVEGAAIEAVKTPGTAKPCCGGRALWGMSADRRFLVLRLPSGRHLWYWKPSVRVGKTPWGEEKEELCYWGGHPKTHQWVVLKTYGGALVENIVQATARDIMANGMLQAEKAGYNLILTVHDELLAEVPYAFGTVEDFILAMCTLPAWAHGCPIDAEGWFGGRYRK